jgi:hypothetical protein
MLERGRPNLLRGRARLTAEDLEDALDTWLTESTEAP